MASGIRVAVQRPRTCPESNWVFTVRLLLRWLREDTLKHPDEQSSES